MGIFSLFSSLKVTGQIHLKCFLEEGFINTEELNNLRHKIDNKEALSSIIQNYKPDCLQRYIWNKVNNRYNNNPYFKNSYLEYENRKPFWENTLNDSITELIKEDQNRLMKCIKTSNLLSKQTYFELEEVQKGGVFYKLWEILDIAGTFLRYEEKLLSANFEVEFLAFTRNDIINDEKKEKIIKNIQDRRFQYSEQILDFIPKKLRLNISNLKLKAKEDEISTLKNTINTCIKQLPFYDSAEILDVNLIKLSDIYSNDYEIPHTIITLRFNNDTLVYSFSTNERSFKISDNFDFKFVPIIMNDLCKRYSENLEVYIIKNYLYGRESGSNTDIKSYDIFVLPKFSYSILLENRLSSPSYINSEKKLEWFDIFFNHLEKTRYSENQIRQFKSELINYELSNLSQTPYFFTNLVHIEWKDNLNENYSYKNVYKNFVRISNGFFSPTSISEIKNDKTSIIEIEYNGKKYSKELSLESIDFNFCILLQEIQEQNKIYGKFYLLEEWTIEDGYAFIFLNNEENKSLNDAKLIKTNEIMKVENLWLRE